MYANKIIDAGFNLEVDGENLVIQPASKLTSEQRQFIRQHKVEILEELRHGPDCVDDLKGCGNINLKELDILNPETKKYPQIELLTEVELEAFNGWYATMRKPEHGMSHEEATLMAWRFLMESMEIMYREGRGRYTP
jgi:hypothetical protein